MYADPDSTMIHLDLQLQSEIQQQREVKNTQIPFVSWDITQKNMYNN